MEKLGKHNHKLTNLLKVAIFSLVMLAPIGAVLSKVAYITFNKNANESYSQYTYTLENKTEITDLTQTINNTTYYLQLNENDTSYTNSSYFFKFSYFENPNNQFNLTGATQFTLGGIVGTTNGYYLGLYDENRNYLRRYAINDYLGTYQTFIEEIYTPSTYYYTNNLYGNKLYLLTYIKEQGTIDNAFYYACNQITQEPLFNWTINTGTYTAINAMFTGLGMQNNHPLAICLCYWMICTMIYIVIDIVIFCITKLTHITNDE